MQWHDARSEYRVWFLIVLARRLPVFILVFFRFVVFALSFLATLALGSRRRLVALWRGWFRFMFIRLRFLLFRFAFTGPAAFL